MYLGIIAHLFQLTASQGGGPKVATPGKEKKHFNSQPHKEADKIQFFDLAITCISTHSLTRRLTAILFNKNRFVQFIFIALYQSPPTTSPPSSFFSPYFLIFSKNIRCESPEDWVGAWGSHYRIRVSVTSKPCFAPMCSTLFLYLSPR